MVIANKSVFQASALEKVKISGNKYLEHINVFNFQNNQGFFRAQVNPERNETSGNYDLSENLLFLLQLYNVTSNEDFLKNVSDITELYSIDVINRKTLTIHLGIGSVCFELYKIVGDDKFLDKALSIIKFEESLTISEYHKEQIIATNLFTLIQLFSLSDRSNFLFKINLSILKLLDCACFE